ncbi:MAG: TolC family protein [Candidatus Aminicenantes bacterium]|jgi:cobalt-zinc-cadmium efflux system outer membrane protein
MRKFCCLYFILFFGIPTQLLPNENKKFTLDEIIRIGLQNNPWIAARLSEVRAKQEAYKASKRLFNPELELHAGKAEAYDGLETRNTQGMALSQPVENPFKRHFRIQMFENDWRASENQADFSKLELTFEIKTVFFKILLLKNLQNLAGKNLDSISEIQRLIEKRAELGEVKQLEAIKLQVETLKARNELNKVQTELRLAKEDLNRLLNNVLPQDFSVAGRLEYRSFAEEEESLVTKTLLFYPLIKMKEHEIQTAQSNLSRIKWQRFPDFKLSGFSHKELDGTNTGFGLSLDIPIWNIQSREIAQAESLLSKNKSELQALLLKVSTEVKSKLGKLRLSEQTLELYHSGLLNQAEESLKISEASYREGEISLVDFLDSQRTYYSIMTDYQNSLYTWNVDKAALEKAVGEDIQ